MQLINTFVFSCFFYVATVAALFLKQLSEWMKVILLLIQFFKHKQSPLLASMGNTLSQ